MNDDIKGELSSLNKLDYFEEVIEIDTIDLHYIAVNLCEKRFYKDFIMYENEEEISLGIGKYISISVEPNVICFKIDNKTIKSEINDINNDLHEVFSKISLNNWRAYGVANFSLAYYNYQLPLKKEKETLIELFVPRIDIRLEGKKALIRVLDKADIQRVKSFLNKLTSVPNIYDNKLSKKNILEDFKLKNQGERNYKKMVSTAINSIRNKDYEKVIISRKVTLNQKIDMSSSYLLGRKNNNPARSYYINIDDLEVIGYSPETVAEVDSLGVVSTFPLAGTRAIGKNPQETAYLKHQLLTDTKEIAEHAVSVKLAFEELEKVCDKDSISVIDFMSVLERGTVQHLASRLKGQLKKGLNEWHAFNTLFPAITASGIPKKESINAISEIETDARDLYSGSVLIYDKSGALDAALVLRSAYQNKDLTWIRAGAGIVKLSLPEREFEETCEKLSCVSKYLVRL